MTMRLREIDFIIAMFEKYGIQKRRYLQISPPPLVHFFAIFGQIVLLNFAKSPMARFKIRYDSL